MIDVKKKRSYLFAEQIRFRQFQHIVFFLQFLFLQYNVYNNVYVCCIRRLNFNVSVSPLLLLDNSVSCVSLAVRETLTSHHPRTFNFVRMYVLYIHSSIYVYVCELA